MSVRRKTESHEHQLKREAEYREKNRERIRSYSREYARKRRVDPEFRKKENDYHRNQSSESRIKTKTRIIQALGGKCNKCGLEWNGENSAVFDFHHNDPSQKELRFNCTCSWERVEREMQKGILVCANCHRLIHHGGI